MIWTLLQFVIFVLSQSPVDSVTLRSPLPWFLRLEDQETPPSSWSLRRTILSLELLHSQYTWKTLKNFNPQSYFLSVRSHHWYLVTIYRVFLGDRELSVILSSGYIVLYHHLVWWEISLDFLHFYISEIHQLTDQRVISLSCYRWRLRLFPRWRHPVTPLTLTTTRKKSWEFPQLKSVLKNLVTFKTLNWEWRWR